MLTRKFYIFQLGSSIHPNCSFFATVRFVIKRLGYIELVSDNLRTLCNHYIMGGVYGRFVYFDVDECASGRCVVGVIAECECVFRRFNYVFDNSRLGIVFTVCFFPFETPCQVAVFPIEHIVSHGIYGRFCK